MGGSQPLFFMKKIRIFVFGRDDVYIVLTWNFYGNDWIVFPEINPPTPLEVGNIPLFRGVPAGRGILFRKKNEYFFVLL